MSKLYQNASSSPKFPNIPFRNSLSAKISEDHNSVLLAPYTADEVTKALFQLHPMKAPGKDGFSAAFFQNCWQVVKEDFINKCLAFLNEGYLDPDSNITLVTLIPKQKEAVKVTDFRPISLIGVKMKVISKMIVNRLQGFLDEVISVEQCAFLKNRIITDNILLTHEINHYIRHNGSRKTVVGSLKLDIAKAYDTVNWFFLEQVLLKMGFDDVWVRRIMKLVSTVTYSIRVNSSYTGIIIPSRGIRQGDPLSPYLFILCTEYFTSLVNQYRRLGLIDGLKVCRRAPAITHLLFADDSLLFLKITHNSICHVKHLLTVYESVSGLGINYAKSEIMLSTNATEELKQSIHQLLGVKIVHNHGKYLGLPVYLSRKKCETFQVLIDKVWSKTRSWQNLILSQGGRQVLINSVLNAIPQYWLSCFLLPEKITKKLHSLITNFWWQGSQKSKGVHWVRSDILTRRREEGGLGFLNFKLLNLAFLAKQSWRIAQNPHLLISQVFKSKYFNQCHILDAALSARPSHVWRALYHSFKILHCGAVLDDISGGLKWKENCSGIIDIKSAYKVAKLIDNQERQDLGEPSDNSNLIRFWTQLWKLPIPRKIKIFAWRGYNEGLPTGAQLRRRGLQSSQGTYKCQLCGFVFEDDLHPFIHCWWPKAVWLYLGMDIHEVCRELRSFADLLYYCYTSYKLDSLCKILVALWFMWYNRNRFAHGYECISPRSASIRICARYKDFTRGNQALLQCMNCTSLCWQKPRGAVVKINCDGAWDAESKQAGIGVVVRDSEGCVKAIVSKFLQYCESVIDCEGLALREGFILARKMNLKHVIFETDSKELTLNINYKLNKDLWCVDWFEDICQMLFKEVQLASLFRSKRS